MFKALRRKDRKMDDPVARELLKKEAYGVLATVDDEGYPYAVPLSYVYDEKSQVIYFHSARAGHKLDNLAYNNKASFNIVSRAETLPDQFAVNYQSVTVFGRVSELEGLEKREALIAFITKYSGDFMEDGMKYLEEDELHCRVYRLKIEHLTGKERFS